jgi:CheY-like chemotaxis protein
MPSVLVVDDSPIDQRLAGGLLEKHFDCVVAYAADGKQALAQMAQSLPELVVTDLLMPEMNGLELVTAVKTDYPFVPVILMTAQGSEDIAAQALRRGAASYVPKRRLADDLPATVERILLGSLEDRAHSQLMHYLETSESVFVLANDLAAIRALVNHAQEMLRCLPLGDETERLRVGVALEEALRNAYYHGNLEIGAGSGNAELEQLVAQRLAEAPYRDRRIRVAAKISRTEATFIIHDDGPGFDASRLPIGADLPSDDRAAGRGVVLMRSIMDEVRYNQTGNEVTLVKRAAREALLEEGEREVQ